MLNAPSSRCKKELSIFFGICDWLHEYDPAFAADATLLIALLCQKKTWIWNAEKNEPFAAVKQLFKNLLKLYRRFYLQTDTSKIGLDAVLFQLSDDSSHRVISNASVKFSLAEARYYSNE